MPKRKYDWEAIRQEFVTGNANLEELAKKYNVRHSAQVRAIASKDDWQKQRQLFRERAEQQKERTQIKKIIVEHDALEEKKVFERVEATEIKITKLVDEVETITRHLNIAKLLQAKSVEAMKLTDPSALKPSDIATFVRLGTEIERQAMGLAGESLNMDALSKEELEAIAYGTPKR